MRQRSKEDLALDIQPACKCSIRTRSNGILINDISGRSCIVTNGKEYPFTNCRSIKCFRNEIHKLGRRRYPRIPDEFLLNLQSDFYWPDFRIRL